MYRAVHHSLRPFGGRTGNHSYRDAFQIATRCHVCQGACWVSGSPLLCGSSNVGGSGGPGFTCGSTSGGDVAAPEQSAWRADSGAPPRAHQAGSSSSTIVGGMRRLVVLRCMADDGVLAAEKQQGRRAWWLWLLLAECLGRQRVRRAPGCQLCTERAVGRRRWCGWCACCRRVPGTISMVDNPMLGTAEAGAAGSSRP